MASYTPRQARSAESPSDRQYWEERAGGYICRACDDDQAGARALKHALEHERTHKHRTNVMQRERARQLDLERQRALSNQPAPAAGPGSSNSATSAVDFLSRALKQSLDARLDAQQSVSAAPFVPEQISVNMDDVDFGGDANLVLPEDERLAQMFTSAIQHGMESGVFIDPGSDNESLDVPPSESSADDEVVDSVANPRGTIRQHVVPPTAPYFPWSDKPECTLDTAPHLTRSGLSERDVELLSWCMRVNGVPNLPTVPAMKNVHKRLQAAFGIETVEYTGKMGHRYFVNSLSDIIAQEYANPLVGPYLQSLPVDDASCVTQAFEAQKWLNEIDPKLAAPMIRRGEQDFYTFEPALLTGNEACIPQRWFVRGSERFARAWRLTSESFFDARSGQQSFGWLVHEDEIVEISEHRFLLSMPELAADHRRRALPHPSHIIGSFLSSADKAARKLSAWSHSDPAVGNPRRAQARGCEIQSFPIWLYCDDTSGNQSKKWNKHNSFLFTAAGLPREKAHQEYNVHFLTTSNTAPVPEMLDGVVSEIEKCQEHGIWAFDFRTGRIVLVLPFVLALLGDNPMQSELACHIGMRGRFFCRSCWVYKHDGTHATDGPLL